MRKILLYPLDSVLSSIRSRAALQLEVIALRHQLEVPQRTRPARVRLTRLDRIIWLLLYRLWPRCLDAVVIVKPETVIAWHHKGFRALWAWNSRPRRRGRPPVPGEVGTPIRRITRENPLTARTARPRRTSHAWDRDQSGRCLQVHDPAPEAAIADLVDIPSEPCGLSGVCRFLRRIDCYVSAPVRVHRPAPRASPHRAFRRNRAPHIAMGLAADPRAPKAALREGNGSAVLGAHRWRDGGSAAVVGP